MKLKEFIRKNLKWIILFICLILVISILEDVLDNEIQTFDMFWYNLISKYLISDFFTPIAKIITQLGGAIFLIILSLALIISLKNKKVSILILLNLIISTTLNQVLKFIIQRPRPTEFRIIDEHGYSFPSGHSMVSAAFYGFLIYLIYKNIKNKYLKWGLITLLSCIVILIGTSRIYLGVHYTSDVIAGILISISYLIIFTHFSKEFMKIEQKQ